MTKREVIEMLTAKAECIRRESSGIDVDCNFRNCDECDLCYKQGTTGDQMEALRVAISALQAQDLQPICNELAKDTISRQAAIDALKGHRALFCDNTPDTFSKLSYGEKCRVDELDTAISTLVDLPPAHPEQKIGKFVRWMEKREAPKYISYTPHCKCSLCGNEFLIENINYCYMCGARLIEDRGTERREE